jgi:hypothetical protein
MSAHRGSNGSWSWVSLFCARFKRCPNGAISSGYLLWQSRIYKAQRRLLRTSSFALFAFAAYYGIYVPLYSKSVRANKRRLEGLTSCVCMQFIEMRRRERALMDEAAEAERRKK